MLYNKSITSNVNGNIRIKYLPYKTASGVVSPVRFSYLKNKKVYFKPSIQNIYNSTKLYTLDLSQQFICQHNPPNDKDVLRQSKRFL